MNDVFPPKICPAVGLSRLIYPLFFGTLQTQLFNVSQIVQVISSDLTLCLLFHSLLGWLGSSPSAQQAAAGVRERPFFPEF